MHKFDEIANDYSNICSFTSKLKNFNDALIEGMHSLALNQLTLLNENLYNRKYKKSEKPRLDVNKKSLYSRMMLSYFNIGVQQEHLKRHTDCEVSYNRSRALASVIGDKEIQKRLSKSVTNDKQNKNSTNVSYNQNSANNSKINNYNFSSSNSSNNYQNFTLYSPEISEIKLILRNYILMINF